LIQVKSPRMDTGLGSRHICSNDLFRYLSNQLRGHDYALEFLHVVFWSVITPAFFCLSFSRCVETCSFFRAIAPCMRNRKCLMTIISKTKYCFVLFRSTQMIGRLTLPFQTKITISWMTQGVGHQAKLVSE